MQEYRTKSYPEAEEYLNQVPRFTAKNPLEETRQFYQYLQSGKAGIRIQEKQLGHIVHVAGTNGKGSVCAFIDSVCRESGYHVGMFTSPHLVTTRERFTIDGAIVREEAFIEAFNWLADCLDAYHAERPDYQPTYFERLFFMMLFLFTQAGVEITVLETGLGGRLDTTNVVEHPCVTVITEIGMDHMAYLGDTFEKIAAEKAGIIKPGTPLVYIDKRRETSVVLERKAKEAGVCCYKVSGNEYKINEIQKKCIDFSVCSRYYDYIRLEAGTTAVYQAENAALAVRAVEVLKETTQLSGITRDSIVRGVAHMHWAGRMEEILPRVYIDGAHNEDGISAFMESVRMGQQVQSGAKVYMLFSAVNDKKYDKMIEMLAGLECVTEFCLTRIPGNRGVRIEELCTQFSRFTDKPVHVFEEIREAFDFCMKNRGDKDIVYIVGSLYLAGLTEDLVRKEQA